MVITWYGHSCFKIQSGNLIIFTDPFDKSVGLTPPRGLADIVLISHQHYDHNNSSSFSGEPFIIKEPGEYEIKGVYIYGLSSFHDDKEGAQRGQNIIYLAEIEDIRLCHLGDIGQAELTEKQLEEISGVDILMIPVGGVFTIDARQAAKFVHQIEPRIIIPMHYKIPNLNIKIDGVDGFLKEMGISEKTPTDRLTIKKKDLFQKEAEVVVMRV